MPTDKTRAALFGLIAGAILIVAGLVVILFEVLTGEANNYTTLGFGIGLVLLGGTAALPATFMPILSAVLKKVPGKVETIKPPTFDDAQDDDQK